ncbi:MAG: nucleotidyltransferase domain-containing protein [Candidatus Hydrogenedentes bacterium]|nr:nucleotidyltransferase domain-containing protein [Candidatus Hydrogenedentota bacterium]
MINPNVKIDPEFLSGFCRKWRIRELSIFGSALRDDFNAESDLDFLVSFEVGMELDVYKLLDMKEELEARYGHTVDFIEKETLRNPWRKGEILRTREVIFAA